MDSEPATTPEAEPRLGAVDVVIGALVASAVIHFWLVPEHADDLFLSTAFGSAALAAATVALLVARGDPRAPRLATLLLGALLLAYPAYHFIADEHVDALDLATKVVETGGFVTALNLERGAGAPLAPVDVLVGVFVGALLLSALGHSHSA